VSVAKLRPVGSRVPNLSGVCPEADFPWSHHYHTVYLNSGTAALAMAAHLCRILWKPGSTSPEVILPAYGCPDLVAALVAYDIKPVLVDVSRGVPWMSLVAAERAVTKETVAIVAVGFLGGTERLEALRAVAYRKGVLLIEDSAQVMTPGSCDDPVADFCVLSFGRGKPVNLMGGGALLIRRDHMAASLPIIDELEQSDLNLGLGWRLRRQVFNALLAPALYGILERIPQLGIGETVFTSLPGVHRVNNMEGLLARGYAGVLKRPVFEGQYMETFGFLAYEGWQFPLRSIPRCLLRFPLFAPSEEIRDRAITRLNRRGIGASAFYQRSLSQISGVARFLDAGSEKFPNAVDFASRLLTLPIHENVTQANIDVMFDALSTLSTDQAPMPLPVTGNR